MQGQGSDLGPTVKNLSGKNFRPNLNSPHFGKFSLSDLKIRFLLIQTRIFFRKNLIVQKMLSEFQTCIHASRFD